MFGNEIIAITNNNDDNIVIQHPADDVNQASPFILIVKLFVLSSECTVREGQYIYIYIFTTRYISNSW